MKEMVSVFFPQISIEGFIDSKRCVEFYDYIIYNPDDILSKKDVIIFIAAVNGQGEMIEKLEAMNKRFNRDYFILSARAW